MKVVVTGGSGFLGSNLIQELLNRGYFVRGLSRKAPKNAPCPWIECDLSSETNLERLLRDTDVVFHTASKVGMWGSYQDFYAVNVQGTENLLKACQSAKVKKLIYTSTPSVVFGKDDLLGVDESTPYPRSYLTNYAATKALAEKEVLDFNSKSDVLTTALRPHLIYGEGDPHLLPRMKEAAQKGKIRQVGRGDNLVDVIYVHNAVDAHIRAMHSLERNSKIEGKAYFISQEKAVNCWQFINTLLQIENVAPIRKSISLTSAYWIGWIIETSFNLFKIKKIEPPMTRFIALQLGKSHYFNTQAAKKDFNFFPAISIEESLERMKAAKHNLSKNNKNK